MENLADYYPACYLNRKKTLYFQVKFLAGVWGLDDSKSISFIEKLPDSPEQGERWFAYPKLSAITKKYFSKEANPYLQYLKACGLLQELSRDLYGFIYRESTLYCALNNEDTKWKQTPRTLEKIELIEKSQPGDIVVFPAQFGACYKGLSANQVIDRYQENEFGVTALMLGSMLMVFYEIIRENGGQMVDFLAVGDEINHPNPDYVSCPSFGDFCLQEKYEWLRTEWIEGRSIRTTISEYVMPVTGFTF